MTDLASPASTPAPPPREPPRRVGRGLLWASGLGLLVLVIATIVAFTFDTGGNDDVQRIDPNAPADLQGRDVTGESVPDVSLPRFDGGEMTGATGSLADYRGRPLVVNFFASYCTPCVTEMPDFEQVHNRLGDAVAFVGVDTLEQETTGAEIVRQTGITYDVLFDKQSQIATSIDLLNMPTTLFVNADGTIAKVHTGRLSQSDLEQIIRNDLLT
jgi:peroxiredoxin